MRTLRIVLVAGLYSTLPGNHADAQGVVIAELGGVELLVNYSYVDGDPANPLAIRVSARAVDPAGTLVTFTNVSFSGTVQQVWDSVVGTSTARGRPGGSALYNAAWADWDSHLSITPSMAVSPAGGGYTGIDEANDKSLGDGGLPPSADGIAASVGLGGIAMQSPTDAFFVSPEFQKRSIDIAYIVDGTPAPSDIWMTIGFWGFGVVNEETEGGASFGYDPIAGTTAPICINCIPEPTSCLLTAFAVLSSQGLRRRLRKHCGPTRTSKTTVCVSRLTVPRWGRRLFLISGVSPQRGF